MTDTTQADASEDTGSRTKIANRLWLDSTGKECGEETAVAVSYEFLGRTKEGVTIPGDGKAFVHQIPTPGTRDGMLNGFGALTLMGNITNTWMGDKNDKAATAHDAIAERWELLATGIWVDRTSVGARVDKDKLAEAIVSVAARKGKSVDQATIRAKLEAEPDWAKSARANPEFAAEYATIMGRTVKSSDELLGGL